MTFLEYLQSRRGLLTAQTVEHAQVVLMAVALATVIAVLIGIATYRNPRGRAVATATAAAVLTIPSFALLGLLITPLGLGYGPVMVALTMYAVLPILRNTIVGLSEIDPALTEAARGIGMGRLRSLRTVEMPLAWPVILAGIRVSTQMTMGIAAIAAYVGGPGLGNQIFSGLANLGGVNSLNKALVGTVGVIVLAVVVDLALGLLGVLTHAGGPGLSWAGRVRRRRPGGPLADAQAAAIPSPTPGGQP
jgi:osmoprotectant transport system permease protein